MPTNQKALVILISQSGETADTLAALRLAKEEGIMTLAFVNVVGSLCCYNKGIQRTVAFNKAQFDQQKAENWLKLNGIQNFFLFFEPIAPVPFDENNMLISGDVVFLVDDTTNVVVTVFRRGS